MPAPQARRLHQRKGPAVHQRGCYHGACRAMPSISRATGSISPGLRHFSRPMDFARIVIAATATAGKKSRPNSICPGDPRGDDGFSIITHCRERPCSTSVRHTLSARHPRSSPRANFRTSYFSFFTLGGLYSTTARCWIRKASRSRLFARVAAPTACRPGAMAIPPAEPRRLHLFRPTRRRESTLA